MKKIIASAQRTQNIVFQELDKFSNTLYGVNQRYLKLEKLIPNDSWLDFQVQPPFTPPALNRKFEVGQLFRLSTDGMFLNYAYQFDGLMCHHSKSDQYDIIALGFYQKTDPTEQMTGLGLRLIFHSDTKIGTYSYGFWNTHTKNLDIIHLRYKREISIELPPLPRLGRPETAIKEQQPKTGVDVLTQTRLEPAPPKSAAGYRQRPPQTHRQLIPSQQKQPKLESIKVGDTTYVAEKIFKTNFFVYPIGKGYFESDQGEIIHGFYAVRCGKLHFIDNHGITYPMSIPIKA